MRGCVTLSSSCVCADDLQGSVFGFLATCTPKLIVQLLFFQRVLTCDSRCRQLVDIDMKVCNDQFVADLFEL